MQYQQGLSGPLLSFTINIREKSSRRLRAATASAPASAPFMTINTMHGTRIPHHERCGIQETGLNDHSGGSHFEGGGIAGKSVFDMSTITFQLLSACFFHTVVYLP